MTKLSKVPSLIIVAAVYFAAFFTGLFLFNFTSAAGSSLLSFLLADITATIVVWAFGLIFKNASMYDPYWSVAALALVISFMFTAKSFNAAAVIYLILFAFWGVRLTINWAVNWHGMRHQDWRYTMLKAQNPHLWPLTNFFGINIMPTLFVFAALIPAYIAIIAAVSVNIVTFLGAALSFAAIMLQTVSDAQMMRFRKDPSNKDKHIQSGLWRYSRRPNYLGEIAFWWGVWVIQASVLPETWWTVFAPFLMTLLFVFISIPMMEKRLIQTKIGYAEYKKITSMLMLFPKKR